MNLPEKAELMEKHLTRDERIIGTDLFKSEWWKQKKAILRENLLKIINKINVKT